MILRPITGVVQVIRASARVISNRQSILTLQERCTSTATQSTEVPVPAAKKPISKAMKAYLERAQQHEEFIDQQRQEYNIGKRHLANMMGEDPETFTQKDVDEALDYLFPSGLYDKHARPYMKPPEEVFPQQKAAEFDETGRPHHFLFYTIKPNFYQLLYDIVENINELYKYEDAMIRKNIQPDPALDIIFTGYQWIDKKGLEKKLLETISEVDYKNFITTMERLCKLPFSYRYKDLIMSYRTSLLQRIANQEIPKLQIDKDGKNFITVYECLRKRARGHVTIRSPGLGKVEINGQDLTYFKDTQPREQNCITMMGWCGAAPRRSHIAPERCRS